MHIEKRKVGKQTKYYLAHSFREGKKVHKIRKFLGADLNILLLDERKAKAEVLILEEINRYSIIKDPLQYELSLEDIEEIKRIEESLPIKISHLSEEQWQVFSELFTYNTNAIEGSELNSVEVKEVLEEDKWPKEKSKQDIAEAYGVDNAITFIRNTKEEISIDLTKEIHRIVFKNSKSFAGQFRKLGEEVVVRNRLGEIMHEGAPQSRVLFLLKELVEWYNINKNKYPALILAAVVHNQFENIHPFRDGNGRVGRILLNNILLKNGLPPISIDLKNRSEYYQSLQAYQKKHDLRPTIDLFVKEYKALKRILG
ncbi:MAG: Filamentation induced by cAMP protein Fic [Parcubacteria group bacterium GW2011_GWA2_31_28]|nr:MAG: Filamentation induced by cAMP protein Fic [Parcubacteria group bacterium GW2011_GWA2_31_28]